MDVIQVLTFFDHFHAKHRRTCGVDHLDIDSERPTDSTIRLVLICPQCRHTVSGSIDDSDWPQAVQLLALGRAS